MVHISTLKNPTPKQIDQLTDLLVRAFDDHILTNACTGGVPKLKYDFFHLSVRAGALEGVIFVGKENEEDETFKSVAVSFGPGVLFMSSEAQRSLGYEEFFESLPDPTKTWWKETYGPISKAHLEKTIGHKAVLDSWVPVLIATLPEYQCLGYGSALTKCILQLAEEDGSSVALAATTSYTLEFYKELGFTAEGSADIPSEFGSFTSTHMTWKKRLATRSCFCGTYVDVE